MANFSIEFIHFLADLEVNNNRDWFNANKERFKTHVEEPFVQFIDHVIDLMNKEGASIKLKAKDCVFRIYRDVRFSKDKSPYKLHMSALVSPGGRKDFLHPGFYIEFTADKLRIYAGIYEPQKPLLEKIRQKISKQPDLFQKLYTASSFRKTYGEILGDKAKRLDAKWIAFAKKEPYIYNKAFYYKCEADAALLLEKGLERWIMQAFKAARDMNEFFYFK